MVKFDMKNLDWDLLQKPSPMFKLFEPSPEKFATVSTHLMEGYLNLSDEFRFKNTILRLMGSYFINPNNFIYEAGDNQALVGFISIIPDFKADLIFKLFDKEIWGVDFAGEARDLLNLIMDSFALKRINTSSPDERVVKMAEIFGFKVEGKKEEDFMFNNKPFTNFLLGLRRK